ncbi:OLC1v1036776C1 [Oldenlandia corymbosa var. corymbosa]|uniref:OLC1v1036776C1 n=1 Tax=Oldenlandia corymbosa var. corymbosa TaxID=529605 RepID=A0AAV1CXH0_OLDCO|nr:OLC1v1036776C1 [Oldenlandia corymbosa var. corymbosa]
MTSWWKPTLVPATRNHGTSLKWEVSLEFLDLKPARSIIAASVDVGISYLAEFSRAKSRRKLQVSQTASGNNYSEGSTCNPYQKHQHRLWSEDVLDPLSVPLDYVDEVDEVVAAAEGNAAATNLVAAAKVALIDVDEVAAGAFDKVAPVDEEVAVGAGDEVDDVGAENAINEVDCLVLIK